MYNSIKYMYLNTMDYLNYLTEKNCLSPIKLDYLFDWYGYLLKSIRPIYYKASKLELKESTMDKEKKKELMYQYYKQMESEINDWVDNWIKKHRTI